MALDEKDISRRLSVRKVLIPVVIGLGIATWLLVNNLNQVTFEAVTTGQGEYVWQDANTDSLVNKNDTLEFVALVNGLVPSGGVTTRAENSELFITLDQGSEVPAEVNTYRRTTALEAFKAVEWTWVTFLWMFIALLMVGVRDLGYMYRIRVLTDNQLSWRQSFDVIMLWEFASSITPSVVGGSGVAMFILNREGINMGKSTSVVMVTALLDELFYILMVPLVLLLVGTQSLFVLQGDQALFGLKLDTEVIFWVGYGFIVLLTLTILAGIFILPQRTKRFLAFVFRFRLLKRWRRKAIRTGDEIIITSAELKDKKFSFWLKTFGATFFSWTARFWIVNFMIMAFISHSFGENLLIYARQLVMWVIMLISPTPGGAGVAEVAFSGFLSDFMPVGVPVILMAILWRLFSYYPYLFLGSFILPRWLRRTAKDKAAREQESES